MKKDVKMKRRVAALALAVLMVIGLVANLGAVSAKAETHVLTDTEQDLGSDMFGKAFDVTNATVDVSTNKMVIDEKSSTGGVGENAGISNAAYLYIPVASLSGDYKISADVTVNELVTREAADATRAGVFIGVMTGQQKDDPMVSIAMRGDKKYIMYRKKAKEDDKGNWYGGSGDTTYTVPTKAALELSKKAGESKFYTAVNAEACKNTYEVAAELKAAELTDGYVFIAVSGANVTIENLKVVNGNGTVAYDQNPEAVADSTPTDATPTDATPTDATATDPTTPDDSTPTDATATDPTKPDDSTPTDATATDPTKPDGTPTDPTKPDGTQNAPTKTDKYEDTTTRIVIDAPAGAFDKTVAFKAQAVTGKTTDGKYTFDLSFTDGNGNKVQPKEPVTVKIPVPAALSGKTIYVYHVEDDGKYTEISSSIENGMVVFTASKFSEYVLSSEQLATGNNAPSTNGNNAPSTNGNNAPANAANGPSTGVAPSGIWILALISVSVLILAAMGEAYMMKKKRK